MAKRTGACMVLAATLAGGAAAGPASDAPVVVVELFTSQGCNSCPPADALLAELARRPGVIALALHVDYWNYLGWRDTFSSPANTMRQKQYARALGDRMIYTPQIVVNGAAGVVGSRREAVEAALAAAGPMPVSVEIAHDGALLRATAVARGPVSADVTVAVYDAPARVEIGAGENGGAVMETTNPVRSMASLGPWAGGEGVWMLAAPMDAAGVVVLVQDAADHRVLGAGRYEMAIAPSPR